MKFWVDLFSYIDHILYSFQYGKWFFCNTENLLKSYNFTDLKKLFFLNVNKCPIL